jgi:hypothetical protein
MRGLRTYGSRGASRTGSPGSAAMSCPNQLSDQSAAIRARSGEPYSARLSPVPGGFHFANFNIITLGGLACGSEKRPRSCRRCVRVPRTGAQARAAADPLGFRREHFRLQILSDNLSARCYCMLEPSGHAWADRSFLSNLSGQLFYPTC